MPKIKLLHCYIAKLLKSNITIQQFNNSAIRQGFTLIELLIVITIIGILASLTLASYSGTQQKARDAVRKSDLAQVKRALELAKSDCSGNAWYPYWASSQASSIAQAQADFSTSPTNLTNYLTATALKYISSVPSDPTNNGNYKYTYNVGGMSSLANVCPSTAGAANSQYGATDFLLAVLLERTQDADATKSQTTCAGKPNTSLYAAAGWYLVCNN